MRFGIFLSLVIFFVSWDAAANALDARAGGNCIGLDEILKAVKMAKNNMEMEFLEGRFEKMGSHTLEASIMGRRIITTDDPENIKAILATQFHDYGSFFHTYSSLGHISLANGLGFGGGAQKAKESYSTSSGNLCLEIAYLPRTAKPGTPRAG